MRQPLWALVLLFSCTLISVSGASSDTCTINAAILPQNAAADHSAAAPGNQVRFSLTSSVKGNCPLMPDRAGVWSTSDQVNTTITSEGLATCRNATGTSATISNSSTVHGHPFAPATLVCK
jgi:hypothetical protein